MSYTSVFGGEPMLPADVSYRAITTSTSLTLVWPTEGQSTNNYVAKFNDVTTTLGGVVLTLPDATLASTGTTCIFNNVGSTSFQVNGATGAVVATIAPSTCWVIYLADNTTTAGVWRFFQYGATTSSATASALAGSGLKAITTTLNQNMPVFSFSSTYSTGSPDRAYVLMWTGAGTGTLNLDAPGTVGSDWFVHVRNSGGGALTIDPAGAVTIDGAATLILNPGNSCIIFTDGTAYYTIGLGIAATASQTFQTVAVGGTGDYTLSASEQNKVLYKFTGTLTGNRNIIVPATIQQYWVDNSTTGAFTFTVKTAAGSGVAVATGTRAVLYCDGTNVVDADTGGVATPIAIVDGGTGATTASAARTNLGATTVGNSLFTAADATAARTAISAVATGATITTAGLFSMATARLLGRSTAGSGDIEAITVGSGLLLSGGTLSSTAGGGSVTSVQVSGGTTGLTFSGGPITGAGTITMAGTLGTANGGTGTTSATGSGANVLATSPTLTSATLSGTGTTITVWDTLFTLQDNSDNTKQARFELSGITTGTTRTYTLPNSSGQLLIGGTTVTGSGGLTGGGDISTNQVISVATNGITNAMLAQVSTATFKGRTTAGTGNVEDLTATQATALLNTFTTSLKGLAPSSGGGTTNYLRADGTWAAPPGTTNQTITLSSDVSGSGTTSIAVTIANNAVTTAKIADSNVTTAKIADSNVTTVKIADANVTTAKIANDAVTNAKIAFDGGPLSGYRNRLINGVFSVNQRGTGSTSDDVYCYDRWYSLTQTANVDYTIQSDQENGTPYNARLTQSQVTAQRFGLAQIIESFNCKDLRGKSVALSARVRCSAATTIRYAVLSWTGTLDAPTSDVVNNWTSTTYTPGNFFIATTTEVVVTGSVALSANTWTSISDVTGTVSSTMNNLIVFFWTDSAQAQNVTLDLGNIQLEEGAVSTSLEVRSWSAEFHLAARYYYNCTATHPHFVPAPGATYAGTYPVFFPTFMRVTPTINASYSASNAIGTYTTAFTSGNQFFVHYISASAATNAYMYFTYTASAEL